VSQFGLKVTLGDGVSSNTLGARKFPGTHSLPAGDVTHHAQSASLEHTMLPPHIRVIGDVGWPSATFRE
jgi:hypothetical protein